MDRIIATYRVRADAASIAARAQAIAVEQSVEMPVAAIDDRHVLDEVVGRVEDIADAGDGRFDVRIALAASTTGHEPGQLMNMLFGNASILDDVELRDAEFPDAMARGFGGPHHGLAGLRAMVGAGARALTCSALKPQGLPPEGLAGVAAALARGRIDFIKDDHGLADQAYSPFARRVEACAAAIREAAAQAGARTRYAPSVTGNLDAMRRQVRCAIDNGVDMVLVAPMVVGVPSFHALVREFPAMAFMAHPAMAGAARIAPPLLIGRIFRMLGADATVFPNHGGRFGYSPATCRALARAALDPDRGLRATVPVPAGGMTTERVPEMLAFYGADVMLLVGGALLAARERLAEEAARFSRSVAEHAHG
jgi:ribulose-bisphosphate carboxylase large chain